MTVAIDVLDPNTVRDLHDMGRADDSLELLYRSKAVQGTAACVPKLVCLSPAMPR
jgi:hypothetical protein